MEAEAKVFEPFELHYPDLVLLSSSRVSSSLSSEELDRIEFISGALMRALGPSGPGLLSITRVPKAPALRRALLPLARKLALLGKRERAQVLKDNGLGSDVPMKSLNRSVSSFAMQLKYEQFSNSESVSALFNDGKEDIQYLHKTRTVNDLQGLHGRETQLIGYIFKELGLCMMELGLQLAQVCDNVIGGIELGKCILDAGTAKGRLIHYHSVLDSLILNEENKRTKGSIPKARPTTSSLANLPTALGLTNLHVSASSDNKALPNLMKDDRDEQLFCSKISSGVSCHRKYFSDLWQPWHYDYGIFTVLTSPLFMSSCQMNDSFCDKDCSSPDEHTYLQLFDANNDRVLLVKASPESFIIQVGESADILSNGKLRSTLHSVGRPLEIESLSRETFVVFLQPPWDKVLPIPSYLMDVKVKDEKVLTSNDAPLIGHMVGSGDSHLVQEIFKSIPPLSSRLRGGITFAEFSRETTKQYYGGSGTQSGRQ